MSTMPYHSEEQKRFATLMMQLRDTHQALVDLLQATFDDRISDAFAENYPFDRSFDDYNIDEWACDALKALGFDPIRLTHERKEALKRLQAINPATKESTVGWYLGQV